MTPGLQRASDLDPLNTCLLAEIKRYALLTLQFLDGERISPRFDRYNPSRPCTHCVRVPGKAWTRGPERNFLCRRESKQHFFDCRSPVMSLFALMGEPEIISINFESYLNENCLSKNKFSTVNG